MQQKLANLGIRSVQDLLFHLPRRYEDRTRIQAIATAQVGEPVQVQGTVVSANIQFGRRRSLHCVIKDHSGLLSLRFFHFSNAQMQALATGVTVRCYGEVRRGRAGFELYHPEYKILKEAEVDAPVSAELTPTLPRSPKGCSRGRMRHLIAQALALLIKGSCCRITCRRSWYKSTGCSR